MRTAVHALVLSLLAAATLFAAGDDAAAEAAAKALEQTKANTSPERIDKLFTDFCNTNFGAETEELIYAKFGKTLKLVSTGSWSHISRQSACIAWETNLPAKSWVEFGETSASEKRTPVPDRFHYIHVKYLVDLKPATRYVCRLVCVDERGNRLVSPTRSFTTTNHADVVLLPGDRQGPPYELDRPNTTYLLTRDLVCPGTAFVVTAPGVTLDLGGRRVVFHNQTVDSAVFTDKWMSYVHKGVFGVKNINGSNFTLVNGALIEGKGRNRGNDESTGFNPVYIRGCSNVRLAGITVDYHSPQSVGIRFRNCGDNYEVHHCVINDRGAKMHNRHGGGCAALNVLGKRGRNFVFHHNLVKRTRQNGLRGAHILYANEVYVDSWATNSFATGAAVESHHNRIFCTGYHAISCPWGDGIKVHDNLVYMQGINTGKTRWWEGFGDQNSMNGLRHTQWNNNKTKSENSLYERNTVIIKGRHGAQMRGVEFFSDPYIRGLTLKDSIIKVVSLDVRTAKAACVVTHGLAKRSAAQNPVYYRNCTFISNVNIIRLGDDYGVGWNHHFINCKLVRLGNDPRFHTICARGAWSSRNHIFRDCTVAGGAALDDVDWGKTKPGTRDFSVQHTLTVAGAGGTRVTVTDRTGKTVFDGTIPPNGRLDLGLAEFRLDHAGKTLLTPHRIRFSSGGKSAIATVAMTKSRVLQAPGVPVKQKK